MAELKTKENDASVEKFLSNLDDSKKKDTEEVLKIMSKATSEEPKMWGSSIIGFGKEKLKYASGRELEWFKIGLSPRKANITLYGLMKAVLNEPKILEKLGKQTTGKGCIYIKRLSDINLEVLVGLINKSVNIENRHQVL
ncbi:MAG: DUF1801 domain-containing protein [Candidatus Dojkabacteria bacterium]